MKRRSAVVPGVPRQGDRCISQSTMHLAKPRPWRRFPADEACWSRCCGSGWTGPTRRSMPPSTARRRRAYDFLVTGHESFGRVVAVGPNVTGLAAGRLRRGDGAPAGSSIYDRIGTYDMTTDDMYYERGINLRHGYLTEYYVDDPEYIVKIPPGLKDVGVLLEPTTVVEKGIAQAYEIQRRLRVWRPQARRGDGGRHHRAAGGAGPPAPRAGRDRLRPDRRAVSQLRPDRGDRRPLRIHGRPCRSSRAPRSTGRST